MDLYSVIEYRYLPDNIKDELCRVEKLKYRQAVMHQTADGMRVVALMTAVHLHEVVDGVATGRVHSLRDPKNPSFIMRDRSIFAFLHEYAASLTEDNGMPFFYRIILDTQLDNDRRFALYLFGKPTEPENPPPNATTVFYRFVIMAAAFRRHMPGDDQYMFRNRERIFDKESLKPTNETNAGPAAVYEDDACVFSRRFFVSGVNVGDNKVCVFCYSPSGVKHTQTITLGNRTVMDIVRQVHERLAVEK